MRPSVANWETVQITDKSIISHSYFGGHSLANAQVVPTTVLSPRATWNMTQAYYKTAFKLTQWPFRETLRKFEASVNEGDYGRGGPQRVCVLKEKPRANFRGFL